MNQEIRNKLRNVVTQCRKLLEDSISQELEGKYGIFAKKDQVTADPNAKMTHLSEEEQVGRKDILDHLGHIKARGFKPKESLDQLVREIAFTHLNRLCAYKMMEAREVYVGGQKFREAVSRGVNSNGVKFYLAEHPDEERLFNTGHQDVAYRHFLDWLGGALSDEIGVLFNPNDPANRLYPRQKTLDEVLELLNEGGIKAEETELREQWPKIWSQDETIGWVYQYFTPKELRDQARTGNKPPANSYELAFRNQFFTPRFVVEFLTDNTLGRIWYEMRKGDTNLKDQCRYMVRRPTEIFLKDGEQPPKDAAEGKDDLSQEELLKLPVHIPHRPKKDPRELKILDPACGSGHFLLYCFDLLLTIYEEAYADQDLGPALKKEYLTLDALKRDVPRLILAHNLHGIDIDLRASQIAALALWLRCHRTYQDMGFKKDRPKITRSNFVCAEPMPGEEQMLKEFVSQLEPKVLGQVVEVVFDKMKLAGEAGSLLKIEEEIRDAVTAAKKQYVRETTQATDRKGQPLLFTQATMDRLSGKTDHPSLFDLSDITDDQFFEEAEAGVIEALRKYAEKAHNGQRLQRRLFAEDAVRGFAFIDLCHKRYDVVLMNPPFGEPTEATRSMFKTLYPMAADNVAVCFMSRTSQICDERGRIGSITDCSWAKKYDYSAFRKNLVDSRDLSLLVDLGWSVMDTANVEANLAVRNRDAYQLLAANISESDNKDTDLLHFANVPEDMRITSFVTISILPNYVFAYEMPHSEVTAYRERKTVANGLMRAVAGVKSCKSEADFRTWWEAPERDLGQGCTWEILQNGSPFCPFHYPACFAVRTDHGTWKQLMRFGGARPGESQYRKMGLAYGKRTDKMYAYVMPCGQIFSQEGQALFPVSDDLFWQSLQLANSSIYVRHVNYVAGQHKYHNYLNLVCLPTKKVSSLGATAKRLFEALSTLDLCNETTLGFVGCAALPEFDLTQPDDDRRKAAQERHRLFDRLRVESDAEVSAAFGMSTDTTLEAVNYYDVYFGSEYSERLAAAVAASYALGCAFGRWNLELAHQSQTTVKEYGKFVQSGLPPGHTGMIKPERPRDHLGILVDDEGHQEDVVHHVMAAIEFLWPSLANDGDQQLRTMLGVDSMRDYFRKPKDGFWDDHISRYSRSRRKAPIYWLLQSSKKNYAIWLYYHRLDKDLLFKSLVNYVEPKIRLETSRLESLRSQKAAAGESGKEAKRLAKDVERQEDFLSELRDFEDKLRRAANLHLEPDLNDGVVLNIALLWELVPWKEAKSYWDELLKGEYEWSSIGKQLREKGLVK